MRGSDEELATWYTRSSQPSKGAKMEPDGFSSPQMWSDIVSSTSTISPGSTLHDLKMGELHLSLMERNRPGKLFYKIWID
jgi:hypothetical protein